MYDGLLMEVRNHSRDTSLIIKPSDTFLSSQEFLSLKVDLTIHQKWTPGKAKPIFQALVNHYVYFNPGIAFLS